MNLFRSEEHVRQWSGFKSDALGGMMPLTDMMTIFSAALFRERFNGHYVSHMADYRADFMDKLRTVTHDNPFWRLK